LAFRRAGFIQKLDAGGRAEVGIFPRRQSHTIFLAGVTSKTCIVPGQCDVLLSPAIQQHNTRIAIGQPVGRLNVAQRFTGHVRLREFPNRFSFRINLARVAAPVAGDQRVAFLSRTACQGDLASTDHSTLPSKLYSTTLPSPRCGTSNVSAGVMRMCRNCPCVPVTVVGMGISFSILPVAVFDDHRLRRVAVGMIRTRSLPMD